MQPRIEGYSEMVGISLPLIKLSSLNPGVENLSRMSTLPHLKLVSSSTQYKSELVESTN